MEGYLNRTAQGRVATELSYKKLNLSLAKGNQTTFFCDEHPCHHNANSAS